MRIRLTRLTNARHRFEVLRQTGPVEAHEMETRSLLLHDLVHYAVESEAGLTSSFYGQLARGIPYRDLTAQTPLAHRETIDTERIVGQIQSASRRVDWAERDPDAFAAMLAASFSAVGDHPPGWLTGALVARVRARLRRIEGQWRATPFHQAMELTFPPPAED